MASVPCIHSQSSLSQGLCNRSVTACLIEALETAGLRFLSRLFRPSAFLVFRFEKTTALTIAASIDSLLKKRLPTATVVERFVLHLWFAATFVGAASDTLQLVFSNQRSSQANYTLGSDNQYRATGRSI